MINSFDELVGRGDSSRSYTPGIDADYETATETDEDSEDLAMGGRNSASINYTPVESWKKSAKSNSNPPPTTTPLENDESLVRKFRNWLSRHRWCLVAFLAIAFFTLLFVYVTVFGEVILRINPGINQRIYLSDMWSEKSKNKYRKQSTYFRILYPVSLKNFESKGCGTTPPTPFSHNLVTAQCMNFFFMSCISVVFFCLYTLLKNVILCCRRYSKKVDLAFSRLHHYPPPSDWIEDCECGESDEDEEHLVRVKERLPLFFQHDEGDTIIAKYRKKTSVIAQTCFWWRNISLFTFVLLLVGGLSMVVSACIGALFSNQSTLNIRLYTEEKELILWFWDLYYRWWCVPLVFIFGICFLKISRKYKLKYPHISMSVVGIVSAHVLSILVFVLFMYSTNESGMLERKTGFEYVVSEYVIVGAYSFLFTSVPFAILFLVEQKIFEKNKEWSALWVLFVESVLGTIVSFFVLGVLYVVNVYIYGDDETFENFPSGICQIVNNPVVLVGLVCYALVNWMEWYLGLCVTKYFSSFTRACIEVLSYSLIHFAFWMFVMVDGYDGKKKGSTRVLYFVSIATLLFLAIVVCLSSCVASEVGGGFVCPLYFRWVEKMRRREREHDKEKTEEKHGSMNRRKTKSFTHYDYHGLSGM